MRIEAVDLFCGAGGTSTGLILAAHELGIDLHLTVINHWERAIETLIKNHPEVTPLRENLDNLDPRKVVPGGHLDLLVASPECTHHSNARGGRPRSDQSRASAWHVCRWAEALYIENILVENVREFMTWGPLDKDGFPIKDLKGQTFLSFLNTLRSLGYELDFKVLNAANFGDATTRERLFILARREKPVRWPEISHTREAEFGFLAKTRKWKPAREIIDWSIKGTSIFERKRPLKPNTMRRIMKGLEKFGGQSFIAEYHGPKYENDHRIRSVNEPLPTQDTSNRFALCEPFVIGQQSGAAPRSVNQPIPTIAIAGKIALVEPYIVMMYGTSNARSIHQPLPTVTAEANHLYLCEPFILALNHGHDDSRVYSIEKPLPTITGVDAWGMAEPFLVKYNGTGGAISIDEPLDTVTARDRFGLVAPQPDGSKAVLDILFRMLTPKELAAAMSFPADYAFAGKRDEQVKQIGNAVPVKTAKALCKELIT